jgi:hypothetical protein
VQKIGYPSKRIHDHQTISTASMFTKNIGFIANFLGWKMNGTIVREVKNNTLFHGHRKVVMVS